MPSTYHVPWNRNKFHESEAVQDIDVQLAILGQAPPVIACSKGVSHWQQAFFPAKSVMTSGNRHQPAACCSLQVKAPEANILLSSRLRECPRHTVVGKG